MMFFFEITIKYIKNKNLVHLTLLNDEYRYVVGFLGSLCTAFFNAMINIYIFGCADPETSDYYYYYFAERPTRFNSPNCPYNKKLNCLRLSLICWIQNFSSVSIYAQSVIH